MKKIFFLFVLVILSSCNSNDDDSSTKKADAQAEKDLQGKWNWVISSGGFAGKTYTPQSSNQVIYIEFSGNSFKTYINGILSADNTFVIKTQKSNFGGEKPMIVSDNPDKYFVAMSFEIQGDKLSLSQECDDCFGSLYERIK